jgi:ribosomal-protein-alanine N-acetyltransferase
MELKTLRFEELTADRIPAILEIEVEANRSPWSERSFLNEINHPHGHFLVAIGNGEVVGYGGVWLVIDEAHITNIAVSSAYRKLGIGRKLMTELLAKSKALGMTCSTLEVRASNEPAIRLYQELGFKETASRKSYYPDNKEDAVVMWMYDL